MWRLAVCHTFFGGSDYVGILLRFFSREVRGSFGSSPIDPGLEYISISGFGRNFKLTPLQAICREHPDRQRVSSQTGMKFHLIRIIYHIHKIHRLVVKTFKSINQDYG